MYKNISEYLLSDQFNIKNAYICTFILQFNVNYYLIINNII